MTEPTPVRARGLLFGLVLLFLFCDVGVGIWFGARGGWAVPFIVVAALSLFLMMVFLKLLRVPDRVGLSGIAVVVVLGVLSGVGASSLWLTVFGERAECTVTELTHSSSRSGSDYYTHHLRCGEQTTKYTDRYDFQAEVGGRLPMVVDRAGIVLAERPESVVLWKNALYVLDLSLAIGFAVLVHRTTGRLPARSGKPAEAA